jgi:penicillin amidase
VIARIAALAAIVLVAAVVVVAAFLAWPLPTRRGTASVAGLATPVEVRFDRQGIPHVRAVLEVDAWRALGWLHASDRLFQMELRRRAASGRLAEVFGSAAVTLDRSARRLGYEAMAQRDWEATGDAERAALRAYADGVNSFLADHALPLEMKALGLVPEPWSPIDELAFQRLMYEDLSIAATREQGLFDDARRRGLTAATEIYDASEGGRTHVAPELEEFLTRGHREVGPGGEPLERASAGSNAWAIAGSRTASGHPLLAGDPHLDAERPGVWYAAHLSSADGLDLAGLTLPGAPAILIGHNARAAWSVTMNQADDGDLFLERIDATAGTYLHAGTWMPLVKTQETIHVKGAADVVEEVWRTVEGPIVERFEGGFALARKIAPDGAAQGIRPFLDAARAKSGAQLIAAYAHYGGPAINVCWADVEGHIGVHVAGSVPVRRAGDGRFPVPGWTGAYDWDGAIPYDLLPAVSDPKEAFVATANDDWSVTGTPLPYPGFYASPDRAGRARQLAGGLHAATVADMRAMQADVYSPYAARLVAALAKESLSRPEAARALTILKRWDDRADRSGPSRLFYAFLAELRRSLASPGVTWSFLDRLLAGDLPATYWDDPATAAVETRASRIEQALVAALAVVERADGAVPARWSFGSIHRLRYPHPLAAGLPGTIARRLAFGPVALPGEWNTLDVAGFSLRSEPFEVRHIPSARLIVDLADLDASRLVLPLGQSGQLFDRHASDQLDAWSRNADFPLPFTRAAVTAATVSILRLIPDE